MNKEESVIFLKNKIEKGENFSFVRYGDGHYLCMDWKKGNDGDMNLYTPLKSDFMEKPYDFLRDHPDVYFGDWVDLSSRRVNEAMNKFKAVHGRSPRFIDYDVFHHHENKFLTDNLKSLYLAIRNSKKKKIYIGEKHFSKIIDFLKIDKHITETWDRGDIDLSVYEDIKKQAFETYEPGCIYMSSVTFISKMLFKELLEFSNDISCWEMGSALDPICVGNTRAKESNNSDLVKEFYKDYL